MNRHFKLIHSIIEQHGVDAHDPLPSDPIEREKEIKRRKRIANRIMAGTLIAGPLIVAGELAAHKGARADLLKTLRAKEYLRTLKQLIKPTAVAMAGDVAIGPVNAAMAQKLEDRYQRKLKEKEAQQKVTI